MRSGGAQKAGWSDSIAECYREVSVEARGRGARNGEQNLSRGLLADPQVARFPSSCTCRGRYSIIL